MTRGLSILWLLLLPWTGCASGPVAEDASAEKTGLTVPAAVVYFVDEDRWELVTKQAEEYPDEIRFETVLADDSRVTGFLPPERVFQPPTIKWRSLSGIAFRENRWVLWYRHRFVYIEALGFQRQPLKATVRRIENATDPDAPPAYGVSIQNTTTPTD